MQVDKSHFSLQVGTHFEGDGKWHAKLRAEITQQAATAQLEYLKQLTNGNIDLEWSLVSQITAQPGKANELENKIKLVFDEFSMADDFILKTFATEDSVWISLKALPDNEADIIEPFNMFFAQGLDNVAQTQQNLIQISLCSDFDFQAFYEGMKQKERIMSLLMRSLKFFMSFELNPELAAAIKNLIENFDPDLGNEPIMKMALKFKNFGIDLDFQGSEQVPEFVRLNGFFSKKIQDQIDKGNGTWDDEKPRKQALYQLDQCIGHTAKIYFTIPDFLAVSSDISLSGLGKIAFDFGKAIIYDL